MPMFENPSYPYGIMGDPERFRAVLSNAPFALNTLDLDLTYTSSEGGLLASVGRSPGEAVGRSIFDTYGHNEEIVQLAQLALKGQHSLKLLEASDRVVEVQYVPDYSNDGTICGCIVLSFDVTDREMARAELRESDLTIRSLLDSIPDRILRIDMEGQILSFKPDSRVNDKLSAKEVIGKNIDVVVDSEFAVRIMETAKSSLAEMEPRFLEYHQISSHDDTESFYDIQLIPSSNERVLIIMRDTTEKVQQGIRERQSSKLEAIGRLAAGIAHEINTPMQFMVDNLRFLESATQDLLSAGSDATQTDIDLEFYAEEVPTAIKDSIAGVERVARIVQAMRSFSGEDAQQIAEVDINQALEDTLVVTWSTLSSAANVVTDFASTTPVTCNPVEINQVFLNILMNAAEAILQKETTDPSSETITISTRDVENNVIVEISDTGVGMAPELQEHIFDHFFTTKEPGYGTGQGLSIAHEIVKGHNGDLTVKSSLGEGSTFTVILPS